MLTASLTVKYPFFYAFLGVAADGSVVLSCGLYSGGGFVEHF